MPRLLGKKAYVADPRSLQLAKYAAALPAAPNLVLAPVVSAWGMMLNDTLGDCTCAAAGHMQMAWEADTAAQVVQPPDSAILTAYEAVSGYQPGNTSTDNGAEIKSVLAYWQKTGVAGQKIGPYTEIKAGDLAMVRAGIWLFGAVDIGLNMPLAAQQMGTTWVAPPPATKRRRTLFDWLLRRPAPTGLTGQWKPGSWGGHSICLLGYNTTTDTYTGISWGQVITIAAAFLAAYMDEGWAPLSPTFLVNGVSPARFGEFDTAQLTADLAQLKKG